MILQSFLYTDAQVYDIVGLVVGRSLSLNFENQMVEVSVLKEHCLTLYLLQIVCLPLNQAETARQLNIPDMRDGLTGTRPVVVGWG